MKLSAILTGAALAGMVTSSAMATCNDPGPLHCASGIVSLQAVSNQAYKFTLSQEGAAPLKFCLVLGEEDADVATAKLFALADGSARSILYTGSIGGPQRCPNTSGYLLADGPVRNISYP